MRTRRVALRPAAVWISAVLMAAASWPVRAVRAADAGSFSAALERIQAQDMQKYVEVLASDTFEGREAGRRGGKAAGAYLVGRLKSLGVQPAGGEGSFYQHFGADYRNILALLPGRDSNLKDEYVVVGGHYDHVGYGNATNSLGPIGRIHNGADDNASGTAGLLEVVEAMVSLQPGPSRSILFAFWDAEEKGLLGSEHWVRDPTLPLRQVRLLINVDMIGRLRDERVDVYGTRSAPGLRRFLAERNRETALSLNFSWTVERNSDHYPFYLQQVPFVMFHTRKHDDYHRPSDDVDKLNVHGMQQLARLMFRTAAAAADSTHLPAFRRAAFDESDYDRRRLVGRSDAQPTRLGVAWDKDLQAEGIVELTRIVAGSPAENAGLQVGDRIVSFGGLSVDAVDDFRSLVVSAENPVAVVVRREGESKPKQLSVQLNGRPLRVGISWRVDDAEPNSVMLTRVVPSSPADRAGLRVRDRIYSVDGRSFSSSEQFRSLISRPKATIAVALERYGRIRELTLKFLPEGARAHEAAGE